MSSVLVTGADGFVGQHLVAELLARGDRVSGGVRELPPRLTTLSREDAERVEWVQFELESRSSVRDLLEAGEHEAIFHLAALPSVAKSLRDAEPVFRVNLLGTLFLLEELVELRERSGREPRILISGSGDAYGAAANRHKPLTEEAPLEPLNPYAVSKAAQELLGLQFARAHDLRIIVTRSFNHTGPGQRPPYVAADFASQVLRAARGGDRTLEVGNLEARRDFTDVRDVVRAYMELIDADRAGGVFNVCSGRSYAIADLLEMLQEIAGVRVEVTTDPRRLRPADVPEMVGSFRRLNEAVGWAPAIGLERSLSDLLDSLQAAGTAPG